ncbi:MAG: DNA-binding transcriptional repressor AcrR [Firmicutes bacterium ADurb.Bin354]|jgi:AcrR family transcriptional regulator|nr:MAG: DNA-binding transcriptional repressor AcrR [Firmicutes bacterium ADurb.Bin354]SCY12869.1 transcriptional regulator, TetR family [Lachnospiraceae bacterium XPB1003]
MPKTEEQCREIREETRNRILKRASLYFARNGFGDTKISDLARHIGIGQGTIYLYFSSKEELFEEIRKSAGNRDDIRRLKTLSKLPIPAKAKIEKLSQEMEKKLKTDEEYVVRITILSQLLLEKKKDFYKNDLYKILAEIIKQGQKEGSVVKGDAIYLADLFWGTVYTYALKKLFVTDCRMVTKDTLSGLLVKR